MNSNGSGTLVVGQIPSLANEPYGQNKTDRLGTTFFGMGTEGTGKVRRPGKLEMVTTTCGLFTNKHWQCQLQAIQEQSAAHPPPSKGLAVL